MRPETKGTRGTTTNPSSMPLPPPVAEVSHERTGSGSTIGKRDTWLEAFTIVLVIYGMFAAMALPSMSKTTIAYVIGGAMVIALAAFARPIPAAHVIRKREGAGSSQKARAYGAGVGGPRGSGIPRRGSWATSRSPLMTSKFDLHSDAVLDAGLDSFPASDPPSWSPLRVGSPSRRTEFLH